MINKIVTKILIHNKNMNVSIFILNILIEYFRALTSCKQLN